MVDFGDGVRARRPRLSTFWRAHRFDFEPVAPSILQDDVRTGETVSVLWCIPKGVTQTLRTVTKHHLLPP